MPARRAFRAGACDLRRVRGGLASIDMTGFAAAAYQRGVHFVQVGGHYTGLCEGGVLLVNMT
jgi:hypothetical protein